MDKLSILDALQEAHNDYFCLLMEHYPLISTGKSFGSLDHSELCKCAIEVQSCAIALGPKACERLCYLGLDLLYPFDNPVDLYNWRMRVKKENIAHTIYATIAFRIDSELHRMRRVFSLKTDAAYEEIPVGEFLVSKARYMTIEPPEEKAGGGKQSAPYAFPVVHIDTVNIGYAEDSQALSYLAKLEQETTIGANVSNIFATVRTFFGS